MSFDTPFWQYWPYHVPNYLLAVLMWTLAGRFLLGLFVPAEWNNYIWQTFCKLTDPVIAAVRVITPRFVVDTFMPLVALFWVIVFRVVFTLAAVIYGFIPPVTAG